MMKAIHLVLGEASAKKMQQIYPSNNTIQRRISNMSMDVKEQVLTEIKASHFLLSTRRVNRCKFMFSVACLREIH